MNKTTLIFSFFAIIFQCSNTLYAQADEEELYFDTYANYDNYSSGSDDYFGEGLSDTMYSNRFSLRFPFVPPVTAVGTKDSPYLRPYQFNFHSPSGIRWDKLGINTGFVGGFSFAFMGIVYAFPVDISNWYDRSISMKNWWTHIQTTPAWDKDGFAINIIGHGYLGATYYTSARSAGLSAWGSFLYTAFISTFAWEYGIEAIMETPSATDLIVTPVVGSILGEGLYAAKRAIVKNSYRVGSSRFFGCFFAMLCDPLGELTDYATKEHFIYYNKVIPRKKKVDMSLQMTPGGLHFGIKF